MSSIFYINSLKPSSLLHRIPAFPVHCNLDKLITNSTSFAVKGRATWEFELQDGCNLKTSTTIRSLTIGIVQPTVCTATRSDFHGWAVTDAEQDGPPNSGNFIAILTLVWAYIFSESQVEKQGGQMRYLDTLAPITHENFEHAEDANTSIVDVGEVDGEEARWWRAILAPGQGWHAIVVSTSYLSPWSVRYHGPPEFKIKLSTNVRTSESLKPASCDQAFEYLSRFCNRHSLESQSLAALAATLTLPFHNSLRREAQLPFPQVGCAPQSSTTRPMCLEERRRLPYYMTLSSTANVLGSVIWGSFWEPNTDCNIFSAWFQPILSVLTPLVLSKNYELLVNVLALHRPTVAPLWLGAILTGLSNFIVPFLKSLDAPYARPDSVAAAWTGSPQSFMDQPGFGPYVHACDKTLVTTEDMGPSSKEFNLMIQRADRWRLLHDIGESPYNSTPLVPWPPFGCTPLTSCEIEVRQHQNCSRHSKQYRCWNWITADGLSTEDFGYTDPANNMQQDRNSLLPVSETNNSPCWDDIDETASITATRNIFAWNAVNGEGYGLNEKPIFEHKWLEDLLEEDSDDESAAASPKHEGLNYQKSLEIERFCVTSTRFTSENVQDLDDAVMV